MTLNTPTPGTIPALTPYQPGALPAAGTEAVEIVNTMAATTAASFAWLVTDMVGKVPSVLPGRAPGGSDLLTFFRVADGLPYSTPIGSLGVPSGNLPAGGATSQILSKTTGVNFDASWINISSLLAAGTSLAATGTSIVTFGVSNFGIGSAQIATHAVGNAQFRQGVGLSIVGVAGTSTSDVADIVGAAGQILAVNAAGTGIAFSAATAVMPGPFQASSFTPDGIIYGNGASVLGVTAAGGTSLPLLGQGAGNAPAFGVLPVIGGGSGTTSLTSHGVLLGAGIAHLGIAVPSTAGNILIDQGVASDPAFRTVVGDLTMSSLGTATIANNSVSNAKLAQGSASSLVGNNTATTANRADLNVSQIVAMLGLQPHPGGRLTITNGVPVMVSSASAQTTLYYAPFVNPYVPISNGTGTQYYFFPANATSTTGLSLALGTNWLANTLYDTFAIASGANPIIATVAWTNATTRATALSVFNGLQTNNATVTMRTSNVASTSVPIYQGTYLGTFLTDASSAGQITWLPGAQGTGSQQSARLSIWNAYNGAQTRAQVIDNTATWNYSSSILRAVNGNANNSITFVSGLAQDAPLVNCFANVNFTTAQGAFISFGVALDTTTSSASLGFSFSMNAGSSVVSDGRPFFATIPPQVGQHVAYAWEASDGTHIATFNGGTASVGGPQNALSLVMRM